jgi:IPT/TIG domain
VSGRAAQAVYAVRTYGFSPTNVAEASPPIRSHASTPSPVAASGEGLLDANNVITPGLSVAVLGTAASASNLRPYPPPTPYIAVDVQVNIAAGEGPKHLLFSTPNDLYVLPAAFSVVFHAAPSIESITPALDTDGHRMLLIGGSGFFPNQSTDTTILFDGLPGIIQGVAKDGRLMVTPPAAGGKYTATVVALNSDGQSSLFLDPTPATYTYDAGGVPSLTVTPKLLVAGSDATVDILGANTNFIDGQTLVGFGTSDVVVKQVTVLSPTHLSVLVKPNVTVGTSGINVTTGLGVVSQALGNRVTIANPKH